MTNFNILVMRAYVFDFDLTMTSIHTSGLPYAPDGYRIPCDSLYGTVKTREQLIFYINYLLNTKCLVFINTRGLKDDIRTILTDDGFPQFTEYYGASEIIDISPVNDYDECIKIWSDKKVRVLDDIREKHGLEKHDIFFFDDTPINIHTAIDNGYNYSFIVNGCTVGLVDLIALVVDIYSISDLMNSYIDEYKIIDNIDISNKKAFILRTDHTHYILHDDIIHKNISIKIKLLRES